DAEEEKVEDDEQADVAGDEEPYLRRVVGGRGEWIEREQARRRVEVREDAPLLALGDRVEGAVHVGRAPLLEDHLRAPVERREVAGRLRGPLVSLLKEVRDVEQDEEADERRLERFVTHARVLDLQRTRASQ